MIIYDNSCNVAELDPCSEIRPSPSSPSLRLQSFLELLPHGYPKYVLDRPSWILTELVVETCTQKRAIASNPSNIMAGRCSLMR